RSRARSATRAMSAAVSMAGFSQSTALRSYLTEGLGLEIDELTARELAQLLQKAPYEVPQSALAQWVIHSEWVRFADTWAEHAWQAEDATSIYEVVHQLASRKEGKSL
ncbi:MAG: hypothetical protein ACFN0U_03670, partial [Porphyromonas asaccharolytica]